MLFSWIILLTIVICLGADIYTSQKYDIFVDKSPAFKDLSSIADVLSINIEYLQENPLSLEFL